MKWAGGKIHVWQKAVTEKVHISYLHPVYLVLTLSKSTKLITALLIHNNPLVLKTRGLLLA